MNETRQALINSMKQLLWERGYEATSPNLVLEHSGAGKGSLYHHFKGKKALAIAALEERADELISEFDNIFATNTPWLKKFERYLLEPRLGTKGCSLGRVAADPSIEDPSLRAPLERYFKHLLMHMAMTLSQAQQQQQLDDHFSPVMLAETIVSAIQGGFVVSRAMDDDQPVNSAGLGVYSLLQHISK